MSHFRQTFSSYAIDRRPVVDLSFNSYINVSFLDELTYFYEHGFRRFVVPPHSADILRDHSSGYTEWRSAVVSFVTSCQHPVAVVTRFDINAYIDSGSMIIDGTFLSDQVDDVFSAGISGFIYHGDFLSMSPYEGCSNPFLRQLLGRYDTAHIWRDSSEDAYSSPSGACDLPTWYSAPSGLIEEENAYSGWVSESIRSSVEAGAVIDISLATEDFFSSCSNWGMVPCLRVKSSEDIPDVSKLVDTYLESELAIKAKVAEAKKLIVLPCAARRNCGDSPASSAFFNSSAKGRRDIICPANIDCSHKSFEKDQSIHVPESLCGGTPPYEDPLWVFDTNVSISGKLNLPSMTGSTGAHKAAEMAVNMLADELSIHPDPEYLGELSSVIVFSNWGRGGHSDFENDESYEACRLTHHISDSVQILSASHLLLDDRDTLYTDSGIKSCRIWGFDFIQRFDSFRQRLAVFGGCSVPSPWMFIINSKLQVDLENAVCAPILVDGLVRHGNWEYQRGDSRWFTEVIADFASEAVTASRFSDFSHTYTCTGRKPDGSAYVTFSPIDLRSDMSLTELVRNRPFAKWYSDLSRASAAYALNNSIGRMFSLHMCGCAIACPDIYPECSDHIVAHEPGKPVFLQVQQTKYSAPSVAPSPSIFMAHTGMMAQGHRDLPSVPYDVRLLAKCDMYGNQLPDWYTSTPIGDCAWRHGSQTVEFGYQVTSSSSSSSVFVPFYNYDSSILNVPTGDNAGSNNLNSFFNHEAYTRSVVSLISEDT
jgi:hypothetical protein